MCRSRAAEKRRTEAAAKKRNLEDVEETVPMKADYNDMDEESLEDFLERVKLSASENVEIYAKLSMDGLGSDSEEAVRMLRDCIWEVAGFHFR